jgi:hypothetical protein
LDVARVGVQIKCHHWIWLEGKGPFEWSWCHNS